MSTPSRRFRFFARGARPRVPWLPLAGLALAAWCCQHGAQADKGLNDGIYRDSRGGQHTWSIQRSHLMLWNDQPYAPVGVVFHSAYLKSPSDETLRKDAEELDRLKAAGVQDLWIDPDRGLLENKAEQTQALIDQVENRGFRYGLRVGDRSREPLIGFSPVVAPVRIPKERLQPGSMQRWEVKAPDARRVVFAVVDAPTPTSSNWFVATGEAVVEKGTAQIQAQIRNSKLLGRVDGQLLAVPEVQVSPDELGSYGDLWEGMESYATRLKTHLQAVKFGPGLRFVMDPFSAGDGTVGREDGVFPSTPAFRTAFKEWLKRRKGINDLNSTWRLNDSRLGSLEEASRLIPMWARNDPPEGDGWLFDPVERVAYRCVPRESTIWQDLDEFRTLSLKRWMNTLTTTLKQEGLNVPMLFTWSAYHPIFTNSPSPAGYDGLGAQLYGNGAAVAKESGAYALAQAEEADRHTWLVAARLAGAPSPAGVPTPIPDAGQLTQTWEALRNAGYRGLYLDPEQTPSAASLVKSLAPVMSAANPALDQKVKTLFFPAALASADRTTRLSNGVWWLPSGQPARLLRYGDSMFGYEIDRPFGDGHTVQKGTVLWSANGPQEVSFFDDKLSPIELYDSAGMPVKVRTKKKMIVVALSEEPVVVTGTSAVGLFPLELATAQLAEFDELLRQAEALRLDSANFRSIYTQAEKGLAPGSAASIYQSITPYVERMRQELTPFIWVEGERSNSHNLSGVAFQAGCSGGTYLKLDRGQPSLSGAYKVRYPVAIRREASYEIWVAGRVPGQPGVSPLIWQVDDEPAVQLKSANPTGSEYARGMAWYSLGRLTLKPGRHDLTLIFPDPAEGAGGRFVAGIDAVVFSRDAFKPNGAEKPVFKARTEPRPAADEKTSARNREAAKPEGKEKDKEKSAPKGKEDR